MAGTAFTANYDKRGILAYALGADFRTQYLDIEVSWPVATSIPFGSHSGNPSLRVRSELKRGPFKLMGSVGAAAPLAAGDNREAAFAYTSAGLLDGLLDFWRWAPGHGSVFGALEGAYRYSMAKFAFRSAAVAYIPVAHGRSAGWGMQGRLLVEMRFDHAFLGFAFSAARIGLLFDDVQLSQEVYWGLQRSGWCFRFSVTQNIWGIEGSAILRREEGSSGVFGFRFSLRYGYGV